MERMGLVYIHGLSAGLLVGHELALHVERQKDCAETCRN
jgi:hypothetical protein